MIILDKNWVLEDNKIMAFKPSIMVLETTVSKREEKKRKLFSPETRGRERARGKLGTLVVGECALVKGVVYCMIKT